MTVTTTGTLEAGKTNRCVLEQASSDAGSCEVTVPGTGVITLSAPNPPGGVSTVRGFDNGYEYATGVRAINFSVSYIASGDADIGKSTWTIRSTPTSGNPVDYTLEIEVYATGKVPDGKTKGFSTDTTDPANSAPEAVPAPVKTGTLVADQTVRCLLVQGSYASNECTVTVPGSGTIAAPNTPVPANKSTILLAAPRISSRTVEFEASDETSGNANAARIGKAVWTITNTADGTVTTYKVEVTVYPNPAGGSGAAPLGTRLGFLPPGPVAPTWGSVAAVAGETAVTLTWTRPSGTLTKQQYAAKKSTDSAYGPWTDIPGSATLQTYKVTGLEGGASYTFKLRAHNAAGGAGAESAESSSVTVARGGAWGADRGDGGGG